MIVMHIENLGLYHLYYYFLENEKKYVILLIMMLSWLCYRDYYTQLVTLLSFVSVSLS